MEKSERIRRDESPFQSHRSFGRSGEVQLGERSKGHAILAKPSGVYETIMIRKNSIQFKKKPPMESIASKFPLAKI